MYVVIILQKSPKWGVLLPVLFNLLCIMPIGQTKTNGTLRHK